MQAAGHWPVWWMSDSVAVFWTLCSVLSSFKPWAGSQGIRVINRQAVYFSTGCLTCTSAISETRSVHGLLVCRWRPLISCSCAFWRWGNILHGFPAPTQGNHAVTACKDKLVLQQQCCVLGLIADVKRRVGWTTALWLCSWDHWAFHWSCPSLERRTGKYFWFMGAVCLVNALLWSSGMRPGWSSLEEGLGLDHMGFCSDLESFGGWFSSPHAPTGRGFTHWSFCPVLLFMINNHPWSTLTGLQKPTCPVLIKLPVLLLQPYECGHSPGNSICLSCMLDLADTQLFLYCFSHPSKTKCNLLVCMVQEPCQEQKEVQIFVLGC